MSVRFGNETYREVRFEKSVEDLARLEEFCDGKEVFVRRKGQGYSDAGKFGRSEREGLYSLTMNDGVHFFPLDEIMKISLQESLDIFDS